MPHSTLKPRVALLLLGCDDLSGGGGAERYFAWIHNAFQTCKRSEFETFFVSTNNVIKQFQGLGLLTPGPNVIGAPSVPAWKLQPVIDSLALARTLKRHNFDLVHCIMPSYMYAPGMALFSRTKGRTALTMNFTDCTVPHNYHNPDHRFEHQVLSYKTFLNTVVLDGIFSWYENARDAILEGTIPAPSAPHVAAARYCFTDLSRFAPGTKENVIVFASRLVKQKRPLEFIEAIKLLTVQAPHLLGKWKFRIYGNGPLMEIIERDIKRYRLSALVETGFTPDLAPVFASSKAFVSMQDFENFTSLSMLEAMASGNAIISRNVGQTNYFVRHKENGYLTRNSSPQALAEAMAQYMENTDQHDALAAESVRIATKEHTAENFIQDIGKFWQEVLQRNRG